MRASKKHLRKSMVFYVAISAKEINKNFDEEYDYISQKTGIDTELVELVLWQRCCFEMENDYWQFEGKCSKCGSTNLYIKELPNEGFADMVVCKLCGTEFIRT